MIKSLNKGISIGISPDGPKGPRHKVSDGILSISRLSNSLILPVGIGFKKKWVLNTWDKFIIPKPFNQITIIWGEPLPALKNEKKMSIFLVEQYFEFAFKLSDYIFIMRRGSVTKEGIKDQLDKEFLKKELSIVN